jgi:hypothetical protein
MTRTRQTLAAALALALASLLLATATLPAPAAAADDLLKAPSDWRGHDPLLTWDHYYDQDQVAAAVNLLHEKYPGLTELQSLGQSAEGRDIWQLTINNPKTGPDTAKPAMYLDGAVHGNEIQATEVCLYTAWLLLDRYGEWDQVTDLLDRVAFYVVPTVNVDGRAHFFTDVGGYNIGRSARHPFDDDHDGLVDEDDYDDVDGDGRILQMRIRDPFGEWKSDPDDPRVMVRVKPGERGQWRLLGSEGIDNDGDGRVNEDTPGYVDMNRNWGFLWQPRYVQSGAGDFPLSEPNTEAIAAFVASKPNICFHFTFHNNGGMFLRGPGSDLSPPYQPADLRVYDYLGKEGEKTVPGYRYLVSKDDLYTTYGDFDEFMYQVWGVLGYTGELFITSAMQYRQPDKDQERSGREGDQGPRWDDGVPQQERQKFNDHLMMGEMFQDWHPFHHPTYGDIEIGGWRRFTTRMPPAWQLPDLVHRNASFVIWTATQFPRVSLEISEIKKLDGDLWRVRAKASNDGALPTLSAQTRNRRIHPLDVFAIEGRGLRVHGGAAVDDPWLDRLSPVEDRPERIPTFVGPLSQQEVQWIVSGRGSFTVSYEGVKVGRVQARGELR